MDFLHNSLSLSFTFISLLLPFVNGGHCSYSNCLIKVHTSSSSNRYNYEYNSIPFPFRSSEQPLTCGLPGFDLICNGSTPLLTFPSGQSYTVVSISIFRRNIEIGGTCLHEGLTRFNSSGTPFYPGGFTKLRAYSCPLTVHYLGSLCLKINCISRRREDRSSIFYCDADARPERSWAGCDLIGDVDVAGRWSSAHEFRYASSVYLNWDMPRECVDCASKGKDCGRDDIHPTLIKCFDRRRPSKTRERIIISVAVVLPTLLSIILYVSYKRCIQSGNQTSVGSTSSFQHALNRLHSMVERQMYVSHPITSGIEQAALDTYPVTLIGNSGRILINMEDKICPICLSNYEPKDVVKSLPDCLHRFHSECIDEWLREKAVCPICRTIPPLTSS